MKVLSYTKYVYLFVAALSIYKIVDTWNYEETIDYMFVAFEMFVECQLGFVLSDMLKLKV